MEKFAAPLRISKMAVSRIESGLNNPSEQTISMICREYGISEEWLRTGEGDMKPSLTYEEEIADIVNCILKDEPKSFRMTLIKYISHMSSEQLELLEKMLHELYDSQDSEQK